MRWCVLAACLTATALQAETLPPSGFVCRQATGFLEFCAETQGEDYRGWRFGTAASEQGGAVWWYPPNPDIGAFIQARPIERALKREEALEQVLDTSRYPLELELGDQIEGHEDLVIGWQAETLVYAATDRGTARVYVVTFFQLNDTLIRIGSLGNGPGLSPEHRQAHAAFLWAIRRSEKAN